MSTQLLPQFFWFRVAVGCPRVNGLPRKAVGRLVELPEPCRLPETSRLEGANPWADVRVGWNEQGLAISAETDVRFEGLGADDLPEHAHGMRVWVDTRDTRDVSRATRFCHRFDARIVPGLGRKGLSAKVEQRTIARAVADAPLCKADALPARAERLPNGWRLELFLPAAVLHGFDPETNRRLGFTYQVFAPGRDDQFLSAGREFPVGDNPSLWSTLELLDAP